MDKIKKLLSLPIYNRYIIINCIVFIAVSIGFLLYFLFTPNGLGNQSLHVSFYDNIIHTFGLSSNVSVLLQKPFGLLTYMFLHVEFFHLLFNMLFLYFFGKMFMIYFSPKMFRIVYILGGIFGGLIFLLFYNIFPVFANVKFQSYAIGASASVLAIAAAIATYSPNLPLKLMFLGNIKLKYIALFTIVMDLTSIPHDNPGGHIAHIGGALFGFVFALGYLNSNKLKISFPKFNFPKKKAKTEKPQTDDKIQKILLKVRQGGYASLTAEEKEILFKR